MADLVGVETVARLLKLDPRRIQVMAKDGIIPKAARGRYDLVACVHAYLDFVREGQRDRATIVDLDELRKRRDLANTEIAELALEEARALVVPTAIVVEEVEDIFVRIRAKLLSVKTRYSGQWAKIQTVPKMRAAIDDAMKEILGELSSGGAIAGVAREKGNATRTVAPAPTRRPAARRPGKTRTSAG